MSACVKFRLDWPSRLTGYTEQTDKHIAFYYIDFQCSDLRISETRKNLGAVTTSRTREIWFCVYFHTVMILRNDKP